MVKNKLVKPFLKWAGGKRQLVDEISQYIPRYKTYYEPFVGAGAILFSQQPHRAVINDLNTQLCITYRAIRDNVEELIEILKIHSEQNALLGSEHYYKVREMDRNRDFNNLKDVEKAARLIYLNKTCYNGLYRVNQQGLFNTPYGSYNNPSICEESVLRAICKYFNSNDVTITNEDFAIATESAKKGDFVYFDPPYDSPNSTNFTGYQANGFDHQEQTRLMETMSELTEKGVKCLLSNSATEFIENLYSDDKMFVIEYVEATRMINSDASRRGKVKEVLIRNWK